MRKLLVPFLLVLLVPATAFASRPVPPPASNGTLSIREGRGIVQLNARGSITGRLRGKITITDPTPYDSKHPVVYGARKTTYKNDKTVVYQGKNMRFRLIGALYTVKLQGRAIFMSAIGHGKGMLDGDGDAQQNVYYDGVWSLNDEPYHSLPDTATTFELAAPTPG
ncbi:MAG TPA: hypothetical protein VK488_10745 [Gaiellaceae bacterium]|jgi:hypothetical protein|nr:hypothetical protein [Gaiellaceae bacterium]